ncbi:hypothetical protein BOX15_Mlig017756g3 [Macrostomum lignano]|uniref:Multidrug and toxin extrusion protein n=1 Tax=Macrostomum lignano TaxID=282301 RepID=A0A267HAM8_9PLAT|nr:hypothetical protein BOX15_Mlig017756g3 [Macrostomum lignano]
MGIEWSEYKFELVTLVKLGWPMSVSVLLYALMYPATLAFCGAVSIEALDIASLAISVFQLVVVPIENGLRWSCLTFLSQALGSSKKKRAGVIVQRSITAAVCMWIVSCGLAVNCAKLLVLIGQDAEIAIGSQTFITILMPGCLCVLIYRVQMAYMDCLQRVFPTLFMHLVSLLVCLGLEALFVFQLGLGVNGAALGLCFSLCLLPVMMTSYIVISKVHKNTWHGWSMRCFLQWGEYYYNLFPSIANQLVFVSSTEIGTFVAGYLGKAELAAQGIIFQLFIITMQPCIGASSAAITRIGGYLGAANYVKGKRVFKVNLALLGFIGLIEALLMLALKDVIPKIFSADEETTEVFRQVIYFVIPYVFVVASAWGHIAALRGCNFHKTCMFVALVSLWFIGHPIGLSLTFAVGIGMLGLWSGYLIASVAWSVLGLVITLRLDWTGVSKKVSGSAERETDVEGFITHDETRPILAGGRSQRSFDQLVPDNSVAAGTSANLDNKRISISKVLKSKIPAAILLISYIVLAVLIRLTVPEPQIHHEDSNGTTVATEFPGNFTTAPSPSDAVNVLLW